MKPTGNEPQVYNAIVASLKASYPSVTTEMIRKAHEDLAAGKEAANIIAMFAEKPLKAAAAKGVISLDKD